MHPIEEQAALSVFHQIVHGPLRIQVHSPRSFTFTQGNRFGSLLALLLLISTLAGLTLDFRFDLRPVEGRDRVQILQSTHVLGLPCAARDHGEITSVKFIEGAGKAAPYLEIRSPGRSEWLRLFGMDHALSQIAETAGQIITHQITTPRTLHFHPPAWLLAATFILSILLLTWSRPSSVQFDASRRQIIVSDWAGLSRRRLTHSQIARISIEDGDPLGWRRRARLHQPWLIVAHTSPGKSLPLATTTDRSFAAQWSANINYFLNTGSLPRVSEGTYALWTSESPL